MLWVTLIKSFFCEPGGQKKASWEVWDFFINHNVQGEVKKEFSENLKKKKFQSALFSPLRRWTGNNFSLEGGLKPHIHLADWQTGYGDGYQICLIRATAMILDHRLMMMYRHQPTITYPFSTRISQL